MAPQAFPSLSVEIVRLPSTSLSTYPRLDELVALINNAFVTSWRTIPGLVGDEYTRYEASAHFVEDMGATGFTWIAFDERGRMVATAGYKPWDVTWKTMERMKAEKKVGQAELKAGDIVCVYSYFFLSYSHFGSDFFLSLIATAAIFDRRSRGAV